MEKKSNNFIKFTTLFLKIPSLMYRGLDFINRVILRQTFLALPFLYTLLAIVCIFFALIIIILWFFSKFKIVPDKYVTFIDKNMSQQIYSTLHLLYSFLLLCAIIHITFYKDINVTDTNSISALGNVINNNTAGIIIIQVLLVSIIVIFMFLMSVVSNALTKAYYTVKVREINIYETPSMSGWAKIVDLIMYISCIISSILLILFFIVKIGIPNIPVSLKSGIQTFFVISIVYYIAQLFLQMLRDVVSDNLLSFVIPTTHTNKMLYFVLNIILAIIIWIVCIATLISYNLFGFIAILRGAGKVIDTANKIRPIFYGIIPPAISNYIEPFLKKAGIDPNNITQSLEKVTQSLGTTRNPIDLKSELSGQIDTLIPQTTIPTIQPVPANLKPQTLLKQAITKNKIQ